MATNNRLISKCVLLKAKQRKRKRRKSPRRRSWSNLSRPVWDCRNCSRMEFTRRASFNLIKTSELLLLRRQYRKAQTFLNSNAYRITSEEARYNEKLANEDPETTYNDIRRAAEVHRQVRQRARQYIRPGMTTTQIVEYIEEGTRALVEEKGLESGIGFPTGVNLNNCAAHYTPNAGDTTGAFIVLESQYVTGLTGNSRQFCKREMFLKSTSVCM